MTGSTSITTEAFELGDFGEFGESADDLGPVGFAAGWFEACAAHRGPDSDGPCDACGWLAVEHTAGLAEVIVVTRRAATAPLRRAS